MSSKRKFQRKLDADKLKEKHQIWRKARMKNDRVKRIFVWKKTCKRIAI